MLKLCKFSLVALHLLLITHTAHTFVLLTANIEDVKQIARKFVSDELAEKIADFIARATETIAQQTVKPSEEDYKDNSQVSAENRMYNIERHGFETQNVDLDKSKEIEDDIDGKEELQSTTKKITKAEDTDTTTKPNKQVKTRSRYIVESAVKETTEKAAKRNEENSYNQMKDSFIEHNSVPATKKSQTKKEKNKNTVKPYKLLYNFESDDSDARDESSYSQEKKTKKIRQRTDDNISFIGDTAQNDNQSKVPTVRGPEHNRNENTNKNRDLKSVSFVKEDYGNVNTNKNRYIQKAGSLVKENDDNAKWWEKELPKRHNEENSNLQKKSWF